MVELLFRSQTDTWDQAIDNVPKVENRQLTETLSVNFNFQDMVAHLLYAPAPVEKECAPIFDRWKAGGLRMSFLINWSNGDNKMSRGLPGPSLLVLTASPIQVDGNGRC